MPVKPLDFSWSEDHAVGDAVIDDGHRRLFALAARLVSEPSWNGILGAAIELHRHLAAHLVSEDQLMRRARYPGYASHFDDHQKIVLELDLMSQDLIVGSWKPQRLHDFIHRMVADHIDRFDRPMVGHGLHGVPPALVADVVTQSWACRPPLIHLLAAR